MKKRQDQLSGYIDSLNREEKPEEHRMQNGDTEYDRLLETVRRVRALRETEAPEEDYPVTLSAKVWDQLHGSSSQMITAPVRHGSVVWKQVTLFAVVAAAAAIIVFAVPKILLQRNNTSIVYAMEQAFHKVEAYRGTIEMMETNELGETVTQAVREVWADEDGNYYIKELEGTAKNIITVNNGKQKWQIRPEEKSVYLFAAFPDPYRFTFALAQEMEELKAANQVKEIGKERIIGRMTTILEVTPSGGASYRLWVDQETKLPLRKTTAMQNAIQYTVTYTSIEFLPEIPEVLLQYKQSPDYTEVDYGADQIVNTLEEAENIAGFPPAIIDSVPEGFTLNRMAFSKEAKALKFYYTSDKTLKTVVIWQSQAAGEFKPASTAMTGKVNGQLAEILVKGEENSIRWQEDGMEYNVLADVTFEELMPFLQELTHGEINLPAGVAESSDGQSASDKNKPEGSSWREPEIKVKVDLAAEKNEQQSVDAGHSPWKLDPVFVSQVFASLLLSPEGIVGDYPIPYDAITIIENDGTNAIAKINSDNSIARYIYLERLVRQDETGIWSVVGYDKAE